MDIIKLSSWYADEMRRYGMSQDNERMSMPDPTLKLKKMQEFEELSKQDQDTILSYGRESYLYGKGRYQGRGFAADFYNKLKGKPPENPFLKKKENEEEPEEMQK